MEEWQREYLKLGWKGKKDMLEYKMREALCEMWHLQEDLKDQKASKIMEEEHFTQKEHPKKSRKDLVGDQFGIVTRV